MSKATVYLVGAGPGDPKLITLRGLEAIRRADVVVYDRLANPRLLRHMKPGAEKIFVGKLPDKHMLKQEEINQLLVDLALQGKTVTRLKGGDPSVFGRVGEEAELLADNGIPFEIVPGITSAIAVPAYAGIPVTHRDFTSSFSIVTGHEYKNKTYSSVNWPNVAGASGTLIFLMGVANLETICAELMAGGKSLDTPVALIRWGTWMEQETLTGNLSDIAGKVKAAGFQSPAVTIVGEVVRLRDKLAWFEKKPLFGRRILVTRARSQASELVDQIEERGGEAVEFPVIRTQPPSRPEAREARDQALENLDTFDWIVFTSVNGVEAFFDRLKELRRDIRSLAGARLVAVGPKTAAALERKGLLVEAIPPVFQGDALLETLAPRLQKGDRILLATADIARTVLPVKLRELGMDVVKIDIYENVLETEGGDEVLELLRQGMIHIVTFTSSSTVTNLLQALERLGVSEPLALLQGCRIACIGPLTAQTAQKLGLSVDYIAEEATVDALVRSIQESS
ncbi:uroporphyrinogen III methyltransferase / synthase [Paenibacillus sp. UNCCL117]|uniref:uroporphyrinogen-III C-methyltransferase n=1 Tax=unclassified Paenibacillus TaxID=185978 RepID=UPI000881E5C5|nr:MULTISPECIES: uroporphyrinogen-III C-methyltransferase [unclassified Paenibacillus]SDD25231.1 uroporphyrinogen III methyltransferase / synthase [Paenibacillus sp. cl123]SFW41309.1 uroporphyrinogen III methyltransferase / synthase [Paenibacillus sp. UNCCL117]